MVTSILFIAATAVVIATIREGIKLWKEINK